MEKLDEVQRSMQASEEVHRFNAAEEGEEVKVGVEDRNDIGEWLSDEEGDDGDNEWRKVRPKGESWIYRWANGEIRS